MDDESRLPPTPPAEKIPAPSPAPSLFPPAGLSPATLSRPAGSGPKARRGFTLIELLVVMAIIGLLVSLAVPRYFSSVDRSREAVLRSDLSTLRDAIDKYHGDRGKYPDTLEDLVSKGYLRAVPRDPITESTATWVAVPPEDPARGGVYDVHSGAPGKARDGTEYGSW